MLYIVLYASESANSIHQSRYNFAQVYAKIKSIMLVNRNGKSNVNK